MKTNALRHVDEFELNYGIEILAVPEEYQDDGNVTLGKPNWVELGDITRDDVLPREMWDAVWDAIEDKCKIEDVQRRKAAGL